VLERPVDKMVTFYMLGGIHFRCWLPIWSSEIF